jgi:hypothetical protein
MPRDQRRAQLLDAANDVFTTNGYHAAAMDDIAEAAGVSKPVLYQHFGSKLDLYLALLDASCDRLVEVVEEALDSTEENADRVVATMGAFYEFVSSASGQFRFVFESDLTGDGQVQQRLWKVTTPGCRTSSPSCWPSRWSASPRSAPATGSPAGPSGSRWRRPSTWSAAWSGGASAASPRPSTTRIPRRPRDRVCWWRSTPRSPAGPPPLTGPRRRRADPPRS